jgi:hypothetical protein
MVTIMMRVAIWMTVVACSSSYVPQTRGRVAVTIQGGTFVYMRDGQAHAHGIFGSGLEDAVAGQRGAEQAAHEYHDRIRSGILATAIGALCIPATLGYALISSADQQSSLSNHGLEIAGLVTLGCTAVLVAGGLYAASAEPYRWDAINQFNDAAELAPPGLPVDPALPRASLGMR